MKYCNDGQWKLNFNQKKNGKYEHYAHIIIQVFDENKIIDRDHVIIELCKPTVKMIDVVKECELVSKNLKKINDTIEKTISEKDEKYTAYMSIIKNKS